MPAWVSAFVVAILVVVIPFTLIIRLMLQLPKAVALSHRRWSLPVNFGIIAGITAYTTIFIRNTYYGRVNNPAAVLLVFIFVGCIYELGLVLLLEYFNTFYSKCVSNTLITGLSFRM